MSKSSIAFALTLASFSTLSQAAGAQQSETKQPLASLGNLTCSFGEDVERETSTGRAQSIVCVFRSTASNTEELYVGTAYFSGPAASAGDDIALSWIVKGPEDSTSDAGSLEQTYTAQGGGERENSAPLVGKQTEVIGLYPLGLAEAEASKKTAQARKIAVIELKLKTTVA